MAKNQSNAYNFDLQFVCETRTAVLNRDGWVQDSNNSGALSMEFSSKLLFVVLMVMKGRWW